MKAKSVAAGAIFRTSRAPITMRLKTSRARWSPPRRNQPNSPASALARTVPSGLFFIPENCARGSKVMIWLAKIAVNTQNITMPKPIMPTGLSKSLP